jgi:hypothetical protein
MKLFFLTEGVFEEVRTAILTGYILMHIPSNFVQVHNAFSLRYKWIEKFHNANLFENTIFASIVNYDWSIIKTPENYSQIYAVRKLVPKCEYLSRTEIRLTRVTIVC